MISFLVFQPLWLSGFILVGLTTALAMAGPLLVRRYVALESLTTNNEVAGFKFASVGVLYAVLLAFATIVVWEKFIDAEDTVAKEAGAAATIYRLSRALDEPSATDVRTALSVYLKASIDDDWPAMEKRVASPRGAHALDQAYAALLAAKSKNDALTAELLRQLDNVT